MLLRSDQKKKLDRLNSDLVYYAACALKIKDKAGEEKPLIFNRAQKYIHEQLEEQRSRIGKVRALILKGRQQGCSTYVGARYFHKTTTIKGKSTFILSHESQTTKKLFDMVDRYHEHCPVQLKPEKKVSNKREMRFAKLNSEYTVGTAGNEDVGRGGTLQYFHGSEVAFWTKTDAINSGIMQSVADLPGTEIIMESTANGMGGMFYQMCMDAIAGKGEYILIFVPWYWQDEYEKDVPEDFKLDKDEQEYLENHLSQYPLEKAMRKMVWKRNKEIDLKAKWLFKQEYPATAEEAFQTSGSRLIKAEKLMAARKATFSDPDAAKVMGVDPARDGDRTVLVIRQGRKILKWWKHNNMNDMLLAGIIGSHILKYELDKVFVDTTNGWGPVDRLHELGYRGIVVGVHFGEGAMEEQTFLNKRAEMGIALRDWIDAGADIPDDDEFHRDLAIIPDFERTSSSKIKLMNKREIKKKMEINFSPDIFDATMLTLAYPVIGQKARNILAGHQGQMKKTGGGLKTTQRFKKKKNTAEDEEFFSYETAIR